MLSAILVALLATLMFSVSTVLQHRSTLTETDAPDASGLRGVLTTMATNKLYAASMVTNVLGLALQVLALKLGAISVVQPVLTMALVFSLVLNHAASRQAPALGEVVAALLLVGGLVLFLWISGAAAPHGEDATGRRWEAVSLGIGVVLLLVVVLAVARRARPAVKAASLGLGVAALFACNAALITTCTRIATSHTRGLVALLVSWQLWLLLASGATGMVLNQMAFQAGPLAMSLPVIASADPLLSLVVARVVYGEKLSHTPGALLGEAVGLALLLGSVVYLSRRSAEAEVAPLTP